MVKKTSLAYRSSRNCSRIGAFVFAALFCSLAIAEQTGDDPGDAERSAGLSITSLEDARPFVPRPNDPGGPMWDKAGKLLFAHYRDLGFVEDDNSFEIVVPVLLVQPVTNDDLLLVGQVTDLQRLSISHGKVTGEGLQYLQALTKLQTLDLSHNPISDDDLDHLLPLKHLESLNLRYTNVTDDGLMKLQGLQNLTRLDLRLPDPGITRDGMKKLRKAMPTLKMTFITH